jgi:hypothetical protein
MRAEGLVIRSIVPAATLALGSLLGEDLRRANSPDDESQQKK